MFLIDSVGVYVTGMMNEIDHAIILVSGYLYTGVYRYILFNSYTWGV